MILLESLSDYYVSSRCQQKATIDRYGYAIRAMRLFLQREPCFADLTPANLKLFEAFRKQSGIATNTIAGEVRKLRTLARWGAERGYCPPLIYHGLQPIVDPPIAFTLVELKALHHAAAGYGYSIGRVPGTLFFAALLGVLYDTGERIEAICALDWESVSEDSIRFPGATRKNHARGIVRSITPGTARALTVLKEWSPLGPFRGCHKGTLYNHWRRLVSDAGMTPDRKLGPHAVRKSHASYLHAAGGDATTALGHASEEVTRRHYLDPRIVRSDDAVRLLPPLVDEPKRPWWKWLRELLSIGRRGKN